MDVKTVRSEVATLGHLFMVALQRENQMLASIVLREAKEYVPTSLPEANILGIILNEEGLT